MLRYVDSAGNTVEENSNVFSLIQMRCLPSVLWHCWLGSRKGIRPIKNMGGGWRWALVSPDGVVPSRMVSVSVSVNLPLHDKVQTFSSDTCSPWWSWRKGRKTVLVCWCGTWYYVTFVSLLKQQYSRFIPFSVSIQWHCYTVPGAKGQELLCCYLMGSFHTFRTSWFLTSRSVPFCSVIWQ